MVFLPMMGGLWLQSLDRIHRLLAQTVDEEIEMWVKRQARMGVAISWRGRMIANSPRGFRWLTIEI